MNHTSSYVRVSCLLLGRSPIPKLPWIYETYPWTRDQIVETGDLSAVPLHEQQSLFLNALFDPDAIIWTGTLKQVGRRPLLKTYRVPETWTPSPKGPLWTASTSQGGELISPCTFRLSVSLRSSLDIDDRCYLVVEPLHQTPDEAGALINYLVTECDLKLRAIVSPGEDTLHSWFDWPGNGLRHRWRRILKGLGCDSRSFSPLYAARLPGTVRASTGLPQELLYLDPPTQPAR